MLVVLGIPTWIFIEWLGERVFSSGVFFRVGRASQIVLAVPVLIFP